MNQFLLLTAFLFTFNVSVECQSSGTKQATLPGLLDFEHEDVCGSPLVESMTWTLVEGRVVKVVDGETLIILTKENIRKRVKLAAIDPSGGQKRARDLLTRLVLNQFVEVWVNPSETSATTIFGVVHLPTKEINRELLEVGSAKYREPRGYSLSHYTACIYRIIEKRARDEKRGLWQNP
jgi:endonuclease YncB( thermonuclease family)